MLEEAILERGVLTPLITWNGYLVDGHHRYKICCNHSLKFQTVEYYFEDKLSAERYIHVNQIGKRNVEPFRRIEHIKAIEEIDLKKAAKKNQGERRDIHVDPINIGQNSAQCSQKSDDYSGRVKYQLAEKAGVSHDTIHKASKIIDFGSEVLKQEVREKKKTINEGYREIDLKLEAREQQKHTQFQEADNQGPTVGLNSGRSSKETISGRTDHKIAEISGAGRDTIHKASKIIDFGTEKKCYRLCPCRDGSMKMMLLFLLSIIRLKRET